MDEDDDTELPKEIECAFSGYNNINDEDLLEEISNWLTDQYEYCHKGFNAKKVR